MFSTIYPINPFNGRSISATRTRASTPTCVRVDPLELPSRRRELRVLRRLGAVHQGLDPDACRSVRRPGLPWDTSPRGGVWSQTVPNAVYQALSTRNGGEVISSDAY